MFPVTDRPKLLCLATDFPPGLGGIQLLTVRLAENLGGFEVEVVAPPAQQEPGPGEGIKVTRPPEILTKLPRKAEILLVNAWAVLAALRRRPHVVLNMHVASSPAARLIRRLLKVPYVQYAHAREVPARPGLSKAAFEDAARIVAVSGYCRELILEQADVAEKIEVIAPGADLPEDASLEGVERGKAGSPSILIVGRLESSYKGHDTLIAAMPLVRRAVPLVRCRVVGDGGLRASLEARAASAGAGDCVDFLGAVSDTEKTAELRRASVFCMPSRLPDEGAGEGFGIVYLEAGAYRLPVVAVRAGGAIDAVVDGVTGILIDDPLDPEQLAAALIRVLTDPVLAERLGAAGRRHALDHTWERMAASVAELCDEVIGPPA
jgi:phosphatidylinositol alpha-1,6-mannosyltransferase